MADFKYGNRAAEPIAAVIAQVIDNAPDYYDGQMEAMQSKIDKQTEIIRFLTSRLSDEDQVALVKEVAHGWKPVEGSGSA